MKRKYITPQLKIAELDLRAMLTTSEIFGGELGEMGDRAEVKGQSRYGDDPLFKSLWDEIW